MSEYWLWWRLTTATMDRSALHQGHHLMRNDSVVSGNDASSMEVWRATFFSLGFFFEG
jgi:hypothetical protein